jgi:hypothetical protein
MKLEYVINHLKDGELNLANLGGDGEDGVNSNNFSKVISFINMGLLSLHTRFDLKTDTVLIRYLPSVKQYELNAQFADSNTGNEHVKYIIDNEENPFENNVLQLKKFFNTNLNEIIPFNKEDKENKVTTNAFNSFTLPHLEEGTIVKVYYRAAPQKLKTTGRCLEDQEVNLPLSHLQALCCYVAARYYGSRGGMESMSESNNYHNKYIEECDFLSNQGIYRQENTELNSFEAGGWV